MSKQAQEPLSDLDIEIVMDHLGAAMVRSGMTPQQMHDRICEEAARVKEEIETGTA